MAYLLQDNEYFTADDYELYQFDMSVYDEEKFDRYVSNAIQKVHLNTGNYFLTHDFNLSNELLRDRVKRAIGAQVEHYFYMNKTSDVDMSNSSAQSITLGRTRVDFGVQGNLNTANANALCDDAMTYLAFTGLLYRGVRSV